MLAHLEGAATLKEFADKASIPVTSSLQGLGAFDELDPKGLHRVGLHGPIWLFKRQIVIIAVGARIYDCITRFMPKFAFNALMAATENRGGIVQFEIVPKNINKAVQATEAVIRDCAATLKSLLPGIDRVSGRPK